MFQRFKNKTDCFHGTFDNLQIGVDLSQVKLEPWVVDETAR